MCQQYEIVPLEVAHPQSIFSSSTWFLVELECYLEMMVFEEGGKLEYPEKNRWEQRREPTTNSTHICRRRRVWTWAMLVGGERTHHCPIPCFPPGLLLFDSTLFSILPNLFLNPPLWALRLFIVSSMSRSSKMENVVLLRDCWKSKLVKRPPFICYKMFR